MQSAKTVGVEQIGEAAEKRAARRQRVLKAAVAAFNMEFSTIPCVVRNLSETGARLEFNEGAAAPERFVLQIELDGFKVDCERVWQRGNICGVRFVSEKRPTRVYRSQVLNTSENALSESFKRDLARRELQNAPPDPSSSASPKQTSMPAGQPKAIFGKRGH